MGRYDVLTQLDKKPLTPTPLPEKAASLPAAPLPENQRADKPASIQTGLQVNKQAMKPQKEHTDLHANLQTSKDASIQTGKPASMQTSKQVNLQTGKQVFIEKYSSYLPHEYKKELKRIALESDRNEYEVLIEAVEQFLEQRKQSK